MKRKTLCVLLCVCMCVSVFAMSGCGEDSQSSDHSKNPTTNNSLQAPTASIEMLTGDREYSIFDYTYESDGIAHPIRQVMEIQIKGVPPIPVTEVYGTEYTVCVRFDTNGGHFGSNVNMISMVDAFNIKAASSNEDGTVSIALLAPTDSRRDEAVHEAVRFEHVLVGWYTLDADGNKQMWDFETDRVTVDANGSYTVTEPVLTLYALWRPIPFAE